mgnify:CR=1 FL=1
MGIWEYGNMKTTLEIPDELFREAKAKAALEGRKLKDLMTEGLRLVTSGNSSSGRLRRTKFPLIESPIGARKLAITDDSVKGADLETDLQRHEASM